MKKRTKIIIASSVVLTIGLAGAGVGYMFLKKNPTMDNLSDVNDPTLQSKTLERDPNKTIQDYINNKEYKEILYIANGILDETKYWTSTAEGEAVSVGQKQPVKAKRIINNNDDEYGREVYFETITYSMFSQTAEQRYTNNSTYLTRRGDIKSMDEYTFAGKTITEMQRERKDPSTPENENLYYLDRYGQTSDGLTNYILNDYTIVGSEPVEDKTSDGKYTFLYTLSVENTQENGEYVTRNTSEKYTREVKIMSGNDGFPVFNYANLEVTFDEDFKAVSAIAKDGYGVNKPIAATVDSTLNYTYSYNDSKTEIPFITEFKEHFGSAEDASGGTNEVTYKALDLLAAAGVNLINNQYIDLNIGATINGEYLPVKVNVKPDLNDLLNSELNIVLGNTNQSYLNLKYGKDGAYIQLGDTVLSVSKDELLSLINTYLAPVSNLGLLDGGLDIASIPGLSDLLTNAKVTLNESSKEAVITLNMDGLLASDSFAGLSGEANIIISNYATNPEIKKIVCNNLNFGNPESFSLPIEITLSNKDSSSYPQIDTKKAIKVLNIKNHVQNIIDLISSKSFSGTIDNAIIKLNQTFIKLNGMYQFRIKEDGDINISSQLVCAINDVNYNIQLAYTNKRFSLNFNDILKATLTLDELTGLLDSLNINELVNTLKIQEIISNLLKNSQTSSSDDDLSDIVSSATSLNIQGILNTLDKVLISAESNDTQLKLNLMFDTLDFSVTLDTNTNAAITLSSSLLSNGSVTLYDDPNAEIIDVDLSSGKILTGEDFQNAVNLINRILDEKKFSLNFAGELYDYSFVGSLNLDLNTALDMSLNLNLTNLKDGTVLPIQIIKKGASIYLDLHYVKSVVDINEIDDILAKVEKLLSADFKLDYKALEAFLVSLSDGSPFNIIVSNLMQLINSLIQDNSGSAVTQKIDKDFISNIINSVSMKPNEISFGYDSFRFSVLGDNSFDIRIPNYSEDEVLSTAEISTLLDTLLQIKEDEKFSSTFALKFNDVSVEATLDVDTHSALDFYLDAVINYQGNRIPVQLTKLGKDIYVKIYDLTIQITTEDIPALLSQITEALNIDLNVDINALTNLMTSISDGSSVIKILTNVVELVNSITTSEATKVAPTISIEDLFKNLIITENEVNISMDETIQVRVYTNTNFEIEQVTNVDLSSTEIRNLVTNLENIITNKKLTLHVNGLVGNYNITGLVDLDFNSFINLHATLNIYDDKNSYIVSLSLIDGKIYLSFDGINAILTLDDIPTIINQVSSLLDVDLQIDTNLIVQILKTDYSNKSVIDIITTIVSMIPSTTGGYQSNTIATVIDVIKSMTVPDTNTINLAVSDIKLSLISNPTFTITKPNITEENSLTSKDLINLLSFANNTVTDKGFKVDNINLNIDPIKFSGNATFNFTNDLSFVLQGTLSYQETNLNIKLTKVGYDIYLELNNLKVLLNVNDIATILPQIESILGIDLNVDSTALADFLQSLCNGSTPSTIVNKLLSLVNSSLNKATYSTTDEIASIISSIETTDKSFSLAYKDVVTISAINSANNAVNTPNFNSSYLSSDEITRIVSLLNEISTNKKLALDLRGDLNGVSFDGAVILDFEKNLNFQANLNISTASMKVSLNLIKKDDKILLNLGNIQVLLGINDLVPLIHKLSATFDFDLNLDFELLNKVLTSTTDGSSITTILGNIIELINSVGNSSTSSTSSLDLTTIFDVVNSIAINGVNNGIDFNYDNNSIAGTIRTDDSLKVSDIINNNALNYNDIVSIIDKIDSLKDYFLNGENFRFVLNTQIGSDLTIKDLAINLKLPKDKLAEDFSVDKIRFSMQGTIIAAGKEHKIEAIFDGTYLYAIYNDIMKAKIELDSLLAIAKYIVKDVMKIENEIVDAIFSTVESAVDGSVFDDLINPTNPTKFDINKLLDSIKVVDNKLTVGVNPSVLLPIDKVINLELNFDESNKLTSLSVPDLAIDENSTLSLDLVNDEANFTDIVVPEEAATYMDLSSLQQLVEAFFTTANTKNFYITGSLNLKFLNLFSIGNAKLDIKIKLDEKMRPLVHGQLTFPSSGIANSKGTIDIWYQGYEEEGKDVLNKIFFKRSTKNNYVVIDITTGNINFYSSNESVSTYTGNDGIAELVDYILEPGRLISRTIKDQIKKADSSSINSDMNYANIVKNYVKVNNSYQLDLCLNEIISMFSDSKDPTDIDINTSMVKLPNEDAEKEVISNFALSSSLMSLLTIGVNGDLNNIGEEIDLALPENIGNFGW